MSHAGRGARDVTVHVEGPLVAKFRGQSFTSSIVEVGYHHCATVRMEAADDGSADTCTHIVNFSTFASSLDYLGISVHLASRTLCM